MHSGSTYPEAGAYPTEVPGYRDEGGYFQPALIVPYYAAEAS